MSVAARRPPSAREVQRPSQGAPADLRFAGVPPGRYLDLGNGTRAFVRTTAAPGVGAPILLLHGLGATGALNWAPCFEPLADRGQVIAIDHRGHGRGPRVGRQFRLVDCADDAAAVLRAMVARPAIVVGYSMGGPIALLLARRHPELVDGLILSATARDFSGRPADRLRFGAAGVLAATAGLPSWPTLPAVPVLPGALRPVGWALSELRRHEPAAVLGAAASLGRFTSRDWVHQIDKPASVLVHRRDRLVPARRQHKLADSLPCSARFEIDLDHTGLGRDPERYVGTLLRAHESVTDRVTPRAA
jgi:3-oxoadipate enol-lactonase